MNPFPNLYTLSKDIGKARSNYPKKNEKEIKKRVKA
jgi:hypothetical protein